jgi:hypothetical protein
LETLPVLACYVGETNEVLRERFQMKFEHWIVTGAMAALSSCGPQRQPQEVINNSTAPALPAPSAPPAVENSAPAAEVAEANSTSLPEPKGPIDPKSVEAAGQVVQHYGALIEQKRWREAASLWGNGSAADQFAEKLKSNGENHLEIGELGQPEGAAGSIYVSMRVSFYGRDSEGKDFRMQRTIVLRRVNDVPGSTEAQRRWHIERIEPTNSG